MSPTLTLCFRVAVTRGLWAAVARKVGFDNGSTRVERAMAEAALGHTAQATGTARASRSIHESRLRLCPCAAVCQACVWRFTTLDLHNLDSAKPTDSLRTLMPGGLTLGSNRFGLRTRGKRVGSDLPVVILIKLVKGCRVRVSTNVRSNFILTLDLPQPWRAQDATAAQW